MFLRQKAERFHLSVKANDRVFSALLFRFFYVPGWLKTLTISFIV